MSETPSHTEREWCSILGELIHTGFRKGVDHPDSMTYWRMIDEMPPEVWSGALSFAVYCLESAGMIQVATTLDD